MNATSGRPRGGTSERAHAVTTPAVAPGQPADAEDETSLPRFTVGAVAVRLEVPIATLRSWNRRYGVGPPRHLPGQHRLYSETDIAVMRHMRDLIGQGANPGTAALSAMATVAQGRTDPEVLMAAVFNLDTARAARMLDASLRSEGVLDTWDDLIRPAFRQIETRQGRGSACIEVEHALSWTVIRALQRIGVPAPATAASIILACTASEMHTLPLEALRAALAERGHDAVMLGADVPVGALVDALARRGRRSSVVLWAQTARTADPQTTQEVANRARLFLAGPGWPASQGGRRGRRVRSLQAAVERLTRSAVR